MPDDPPAPLVTVIVAVRDSAATIERCLESVLGQDLAGIELLVADGASTDGTVAVLERLAPRLAWWVSEPDRGIYDAWDRALAHASGDWVCFLGADDRFAGPGVLSAVAPSLEAAARAGTRVVYGRLDVVAADGTVVRELGAPWDEIRDAFRDHMTLPHPATFQHRSLFELRGEFDRSFRISGDYELLLRELLDHDPVFVPEPVLVLMGAGGISDRPSSASTLILETHRARRMHGLVSGPAWRSPRIVRSLAYHRLARTLGPGAAEAAAEAWHALRGTPRAGREP